MLHNPAWVVGLLIGCVTGSASGQDAPTTTRAVETQADRALRRMSAYLAEAKQFSFEAHDMVDELLETGQKIQFSSTRRIAVRRPDRIAAEIAGDLLQERVCYDGSMLTVWDIRQKVSGKIEVPDNIDDMLDHVAQRLGITMPLADLLFSDPYEAVIGQVRLGQYVGLHEVQGVKCHHLAFRQDSLDWQIWIEDGDRPLPRKLVITYKASPGQPQYIALLGPWNMSPDLPDSAFALEIPEGVERIDLEAAVGQAAPESTQGDASGAEDQGSR